MKHSKIGSLMVNDVVSVIPQTPFKEVAKLLAVHRISGLPVLDADDKVLGVISESDLMLRQAGETPTPGGHEARAPWRAQPSGDTSTPEVKARAVTAGELMSRPAITVHVGDTIAEAARAMAKHRVERLPVVDEEGRLVGIVTRRDLLQVFLRPDPDIRREIVEEVLDRTLWLSPGTVEVHVIDGVVTLDGQLERFTTIPVAVRLTLQVDGVVSVIDKLTYRYDDSGTRQTEQTTPGAADNDGRSGAVRERSP
ncbi:MULTISPECIES: CBS domain-containing protein [unclassified Streptomyces]|uniref:CBS domain-containing protein n=1 Tax=unclassified Streptomyces TaxID=2593676 RepID=UPI002DDA865D|nr:CBS domain-containing protein [Streptomyces sp. NBC_01750]WSB04408.1 CBS domain-containing protein [Streptomyces sp. NBC_01794]WSD31310.1 CBS domain-containing protein [Streptomyces sp. NBC_01750]